MAFDLIFFLVAIPAVFMIGLEKGGFGIGGGFLATPLLVTVLPPEVAVGLVLPLLMVADAASLRAYWRFWDWPTARTMMLAVLPGIGLGVLLYGWADPDSVRLAIGLIALAFTPWNIARRRGWLGQGGGPLGPVAATAAGLASGFTSFVAHAGGPPAAIYLLSRGLPKRTFQATTVLTFAWVNLLKLPPFAFLGLITEETLLGDLILAPIAVLGVIVGVWAHRRIPEGPFFLLMQAGLFLTGARLVWSALN
ncbi:MAG TPA: sulfite exporter TauE/SafE family protein [Paracoccaceae bacterium]|nr:sulfite exporter TauE/SafE family protein [Paracoccaceae bacterium]